MEQAVYALSGTPVATTPVALRATTLSVIGGADRGTQVKLFDRRKQAWLATFLDLRHGMPLHGTFGRVFAQLEAGFSRRVQSRAETL